MGSRRSCNKLTSGYGISKGKSNLATGSFSFVNEMDINDLEQEVDLNLFNDLKDLGNTLFPPVSVLQRVLWTYHYIQRKRN